MKIIPSYVNGEFVSEADQPMHEVFNPALGKPIAKLPFSSNALIEAAIEAADLSFRQWSAVPPIKRARVLFKFKALLEANIDELAKQITQEHGKVLDDSLGEVLRAIELVEYMCAIPSLLKGTYSQNVANGVDTYTTRQPIGICVGVTPFNFPIMVPVWMFVSAIACGNSFILKPSEKDPSASMLLADLLKQAGLLDGVFNIVHGQESVVDKLISDPRVSAVCCVGSTAVAQKIYQRGIGCGKRAHTFGGAKNHCVVMPDADLDAAAEAIVGAAYGSAGERCMALSAVVAVTDHVAEHLIKNIESKIAQLTVGSGTGNKIDMGPLVTKDHLQRVESLVQQGIDEGAELVADGRDLTVAGYEHGFFLGPCLFDKVLPSMKVYQQEIFGPVLSVLRVSTLERAINLINSHEYGNGSAIFTCDGYCARKFSLAINTGMVGVNVPIPVPVAFHSFGGWKSSFFGDLAMHGQESVLFYTKAKTVTTRWLSNQSMLDGFHMPSH